LVLERLLCVTESVVVDKSRRNRPRSEWVMVEAFWILMEKHPSLPKENTLPS
jgi:hypothetical protein